MQVSFGTEFSRLLAGDAAARSEAAIERQLARSELALYPEIRQLTFDISAALMRGAGERIDPALARDFETFVAGLFTIPVELPFTAFSRAKRARCCLIAHLHRAIDARIAGGDDGRDVYKLLLAAPNEGSTLPREEPAEQMQMLMLVLRFADSETLISWLTNFCMLMAQAPGCLWLRGRGDELRKQRVSFLLDLQAVALYAPRGGIHVHQSAVWDS